MSAPQITQSVQTATSVVYPGLPSSVALARLLIRDLLAGSPRLDDVELIGSELMTNAIRHTPSGQDGGTFTFTIERTPRWTRIEVEDLGSGSWQPVHGDSSAEYGRGLVLVTALADHVGHGAAIVARHRSWAEVSW
jgi:anti-sigma regulatory factor (Ser/Thr protein kinase)